MSERYYNGSRVDPSIIRDSLSLGLFRFTKHIVTILVLKSGNIQDGGSRALRYGRIYSHPGVYGLAPGSEGRG